MFFTAQMRYTQIIVLEKDFQKTIDLLADFGWLEIKRDNEIKSDKNSDINEIHDKINKKIFDIADFLNIDISDKKGTLRNIEEIDQYFSSLQTNIQTQKEKIQNLFERKKELEHGLKELEQFKNLKISKKELDKLNFLYFTIGSLVHKDLDYLINNMKGRLTYLELNKDLYILFTSKKGKWTLESELKKISFKEKPIPFEDDVLPAEVFLKIQEEMNKIEKQIEKIELFRKEILKSEGNKLISMIESFNLQKIYQGIYQTINHSGTTSVIEGWILKKQLSPLSKKIHSILGDRVSIISYKPEEIEEVKNGSLKVPVLMENFFIFKPFEKLVFNYGAPLYGTVDPTIFVAISFLLLFGLMFGDMGQGLIILLIGLIMKNIKKFRKFNDIAPILIMVGISAMVFGYLYGSAFCFEHEELKSLLLPINKTLFGINHPYIINISINNITSVIDLFKLTVGFGIFLNLLGMLINIVNNFSKKKIGEALFSRTGIAGFVMLLSIAIILFQLIILKISPFMFLMYITLFSILFIIMNEPLTNIITRNKRIFNHGFGMWLLHSVVELIEIILSTMSNNLSFIRVGAFAFAHALLSFTTLKLAQIIGGSFFSVSGILIIIFGNVIIICLEGLIVSIQTIRLQYYEFFSKFFTELGKKFIPFKINKNKLEDII
ncbi:MAG: hypothetical protein KAT05_12765 [Spirochaetes bacterium]|nr:hypothetical protein [Spirochaetota bacterium]